MQILHQALPQHKSNHTIFNVGFRATDDGFSDNSAFVVINPGKVLMVYFSNFTEL